MSVDRLSISLDAGLAAEIRQSARRSGTSVSAWLAEAAAVKLRSEAFRDFIREWVPEPGPLTVEEMRRARADFAEATRSAAWVTR